MPQLLKKHKRNRTKKEILITLLSSLGLAASLSMSVFIIGKLIVPQYQKVKQLKETKELTQKQLEYLNKYSTEELKKIYEKTLKFIPAEVNLGEFGNFITQSAEDFNVHIVQLSLTEEAVVEEQTATEFSIKYPLKNIIIPLQISGDKQNLLSYLNFLTRASSIINFEEIQLNERTDSEENTEYTWHLRVQLTQRVIPFIEEIPPTVTLYPLPNIDLDQLTNPTAQ